MVLSPSRVADLTNGYERRTDGLWLHHGKFSVGPIGDAPVLAGDINANRGNGTGVYYFGGNSTKYLYYDGTNFSLIGGALAFTPAANSIPTSAIAANAVQQLIGSYQGAPAFTATTAWGETPIQTTATTGGGLLRIECQTSWFSNTVGSYVWLGLGIDGTLTGGNGCQISFPSALGNSGFLIFYATPAAGSHRFALFAAASGASQSQISTGIYSYLYVTEQKR